MAAKKRAEEEEKMARAKRQETRLKKEEAERAKRERARDQRRKERDDREARMKAKAERAERYVLMQFCGEISIHKPLALRAEMSRPPWQDRQPRQRSTAPTRPLLYNQVVL